MMPCTISLAALHSLTHACAQSDTHIAPCSFVQHKEALLLQDTPTSNSEPLPQINPPTPPSPSTLPPVSGAHSTAHSTATPPSTAPLHPSPHPLHIHLHQQHQHIHHPRHSYSSGQVMPLPGGSSPGPMAVAGISAVTAPVTAGGAGAAGRPRQGASRTALLSARSSHRAHSYSGGSALGPGSTGAGPYVGSGAGMYAGNGAGVGDVAGSSGSSPFILSCTTGAGRPLPASTPAEIAELFSSPSGMPTATSASQLAVPAVVPVGAAAAQQAAGSARPMTALGYYARLQQGTAGRLSRTSAAQ